MASARSSPNSPGSPLSSLSSEDFAADVKPEEFDGVLDAESSPPPIARPAKRQRTGPAWEPRRETPEPIPDEDEVNVSSDTEGSVPGSPGHPVVGAQDEEAMGHEQVSVCKWDGCEAGDTGNMDNLVEHIHEEHIGARRQKYSCEWMDCIRKGTPHASGYALRAHMRSHTREKPFYCTLPECDRSFTRSDALAKHMRTVHETEALRPSDPVPKHHSSNPSNRLQRLRLTFNKAGTGSGSNAQGGSDHEHGDDYPLPASTDPNNITYELIQSKNSSSSFQPLISHANPQYKVIFPSDIRFTPAESALPADELFNLLRRQHAWEEADGASLKHEVQDLEQQRREEWIAKELVLDNVMEAELEIMDLHAKRKRKRRGSKLPAIVGEQEIILSRMRRDVNLAKGVQPTGPIPWWRQEKLNQEERLVTTEKTVHQDESVVVTGVPDDAREDGLPIPVEAI